MNSEDIYAIWFASGIISGLLTFALCLAVTGARRTSTQTFAALTIAILVGAISFPVLVAFGALLAFSNG